MRGVSFWAACARFLQKLIPAQEAEDTEDVEAEGAAQIIPKIKQLFWYGVFGVLTTLINIAVYALCTRAVPLNELVATCIAWIIAVVFSFVTNRRFVFESTTTGARGVLVEALSFFASRVLTGLFDVAFMYVGLSVLKVNDIAVKAASNIIVIVANFVLSKCFVFKKPQQAQEAPKER